ncbi:hypothetical protein GN956_G15311 [Arapaima gigas]
MCERGERTAVLQPSADCSRALPVLLVPTRIKRDLAPSLRPLGSVTSSFLYKHTCSTRWGVDDEGRPTEDGTRTWSVTECLSVSTEKKSTPLSLCCLSLLFPFPHCPTPRVP